MNKVFCIGNSHVNFFTNSDPAASRVYEQTPASIKVFEDTMFVSVCVGPCTAWRFYDKYLTIGHDAVLNMQVNKDNDYIMLVWGEIDCRHHILRQAHQQSKSYIDIVNQCCDNFFRSVDFLRNNNFKNIIIWGPHPSTNIVASKCHPDGPIYGDTIQRNTVTQYWNIYIKSLCDKSGIHFATIFDDLLNDDMTTKDDCFRDNDYIHLNDKYCEIGCKRVLSAIKK